ncbi:LAME_0A00672g1_1 [Lachancea meyersii CBS 8951]|uniref:LAME_0A00672g1_1 n=1 Tax=Lachancea meyersii CBS 8951 TaxID=1266667 RepID=A0A1G4IL86_9SACH|nr:LAME_0A00672g1_1 [Lachancea meyersii CBS 8951]
MGNEMGSEIGNENVNSKQLSKKNRKSRYRPIWLFLLQVFFCVVVPALVVAVCLFYVNVPHRHSSDSDSESVLGKTESWRLDTQKNYTIDLDYWKTQTPGVDRHYYLNVSTMSQVAPDGIERNVTVINGQYPGPLVEANAGDTLFLHVQAQGVPTTIHCHGLFFNKNESFNDGAAFINQCPIDANGGTYDYEIHLDENQSGTYWYHSHYGAQQADGVFGPLVIHSARERELINDSYDAEVVVMVNDYYHAMANSYLPEYLGPDNENTEPTPDDGLIQGTNDFKYDSATYVTPNGDTDLVPANFTQMPPAVFNFDPHKRYRIRVINAGFFAPFNFAIDRHKMKVVEADGTVTEPLELESIDMSVAQRYSFILEPQDTRLSEYWMRVRFNSFCFAQDNANFNTSVSGVIRYDHKGTSLPSSESWEYFGDDVRCRDFNQTLLRTLEGQVPRVQNGSTRPDVIVELDVSFMIKGNQLDRGYFNDMTYTALANSSTMNVLAKSHLQNSIKELQTTQVETKNDGQYLINLDKRGAVVDLIINNYDDGAHPFHLHGHKFWVLSSADRGYFKKSFYDSDNGEMDFTNPISRDVLGVSGFGYAVIRFVVDNPGVWPFHCHIGWHMESGLLLQINELQSEYSSWTHIPSAWDELCQTSA